ncbi:MAG TPA: NAD(P)(+) transhydrogenase (Re/Si-specific) subunit beta [Polyangiaceae bacterium]
MNENFATVAYLVSGILFILSLSGLSAQETAKRGNLFGIIGMGLAIATTVSSVLSAHAELVLGGLILGGIIGAILAVRVAMTNMPQLVAALHSFVGLAAVLVGFATYLDPRPHMSVAEALIHELEIYAGVFVGALTFTGSLVAFGKLQGLLGGKAVILPARHAINVVMLLVASYLAWQSIGKPIALASTGLFGVAGIAAILGVHMVLAIGGADMPVVVSMLNSYSGWAASAAGFMLGNDLLIITGALVGSSGAILSYVMCEAMNRSFVSVILGGFGATPVTQAKAIEGQLTPIDIDGTVEALLDARNVVVVPGYGMAVAQAQHPLYELTQILRARGANVRFAIHPVAGRLPGHMNVLLAEAKVPYDIVLEMEEINEDFPTTNVVLVIGANDIVNPGAIEDPSSPIYGMPVLEVWKAQLTVVLKRGLSPGYAGVENPLFFKDNTRMLFGDAKKTVETLLAQLKAHEATSSAA